MIGLAWILLLGVTRAHAVAYILTGGPGSGKTSIALGLEIHGKRVVRESATDLIAYHRARGDAKPWLRPDYQIEMARLQLLRERRLVPAERAYLDRTAIDCLAYCEIAGRPPAPELLRLIDEIGSAHHAPFVFMIAGSGVVERTEYRFESADEAEVIAASLSRVFEARGYTIVDVPWGDLNERVRFVREFVARVECGDALAPRPDVQGLGKAEEHEKP